ncbi:MAG: protein kinase, partial [Myxococcales bacterium]|nr:protein kinase [Myxococcales bacterium]
DLKPSNVMVERLGEGRLRPVVMDFGLARDSASSVAQGLTESGAVIGTPAYMSPEQARGEARRLDRRSDVYSLGATLYDLLSGKPPFQDETVVNLLLKVMNDSPQPLRSQLPGVPEALDLIVSKCLNKEAEQRYPTALALAQDLDRFLSVGRVEARRLGYLYRLRYWAKRNRALSALALALFIGGLGSIAVFVRNHLQNLRREAEAKAEAALAQTLGQSVKDLEWLVRTAYLLPLHDTRYEKGLVRQRMAAIHKDLQSAGEKGTRLGAYVLGRGHLALHEWDAAYEQLSQAEKLGYRDSGLDYALGRVLGEKYSRALDEARKSGDKSFVEKRKKELEAAFLVPARSYLLRGRRQTTESPNYVEALLDFYNEHYDAALLNAHMARKQAPWLYEAAKLEGDVHMVRALAQRDHGDSASAEKSFALAVARYEDAAAVGHSDHQVHEALAEAWIRQEEMDLYRGIDPTPKLHKALTAADHAIEAAPTESYGHTKKAFAYDFVTQFLLHTGLTDKALIRAQIQEKTAQLAVEINPNYAYAFDALGISVRAISEILKEKGIDFVQLLPKAYTAFEKAISINANFPWAINDYAGTLLIEAQVYISRNNDPAKILNRISELCKLALSIDPNQVNPHITLQNSLILQAQWNTEHGISSDIQDQQIANIIDTLNSRSIKHPLINWNHAVFLQHRARYDIDRKILDGKILERTHNVIRDLLSDFADLPEAYALAAESNIIAASSLTHLSVDTKSLIQIALSYLDKCLKLSEKMSDCMLFSSYAKILNALSSPTTKETDHNPTLPALRSVVQIADKYHNNEKYSLLCAELALHALNFGKLPREIKPEIIRDGIECAKRTLIISPGWPRALAIYAALRAGGLSIFNLDRVENATLKAIDSDLRQSFHGNPNLRHRYGDLAKEVERRLAERQAGR